MSLVPSVLSKVDSKNIVDLKVPGVLGDLGSSGRLAGCVATYPDTSQTSWRRVMAKGPPGEIPATGRRPGTFFGKFMRNILYKNLDLKGGIQG